MQKKTVKNRLNSLTQVKKSDKIDEHMFQNICSHRFKKVKGKNTEVLLIWQQKDQEKI